MMKSILIICGIFLTTISFAQENPIKVKNGYQIKIKTSAVCKMCKETIERDLTFEKGVKDVNLDVESKILTIVYKAKKTEPQILRKRVTEIGYHADNQQRDSTAYENLPDCCKDGAHSEDN